MKWKARSFGRMTLLLTALLAICLATTGLAQKRVLVIPFDRFEFHTEVSLQKINEANLMVGDQYYPALVRTMTDAFTLNGSKEVTYRLIGENDYDKLRRYLQFKYDTKSGHFECSLDLLHKSMYKQILQEYNCDYMLIIGWYRILEKRDHAKIDNTNVYDLYTEHFFDYDLFNMEMIRVQWKSNIKFQVEPTDENLKYHGVRISDLRPVYERVIQDMTQHLLGEE